MPLQQKDNKKSRSQPLSENSLSIGYTGTIDSLQFAMNFIVTILKTVK